jgi:hypothetical protein
MLMLLLPTNGLPKSDILAPIESVILREDLGCSYGMFVCCYSFK